MQKDGFNEGGHIPLDKQHPNTIEATFAEDANPMFLYTYNPRKQAQNIQSQSQKIFDNALNP